MRCGSACRRTTFRPSVGGWRRFFEYVPLERETGVSRSGAAYSEVEVRYRLAE